jgi:hypothetical protein
MDREAVERALASVNRQMQAMERQIAREREVEIARQQTEQAVAKGLDELRREVDRCIRRIGGQP